MSKHFEGDPDESQPAPWQYLHFLLKHPWYYDFAPLDFPIIELNQIETLSALLIDKWN